MAPKKRQKTEEEAGDRPEDEQEEDEEQAEEMSEEVKDEEEVKEELQEEDDAPADSRKKLAQSVSFHTADTTPNVVPSSVGNMLLTIKDNALRYLCAGARGNVGVKSGRYAFEVTVVETLNPADVPQAKPLASVPKSVLRVGFSTACSALMLGDGADNCCFDGSGDFMHNQVAKANRKPTIFASGSSIVVVLNLDEKTPHANTVSLFIDGERHSDPQALPEALRGKVLYPTVMFKNVTVHANFIEEPASPLPFKCRMLGDAAAADVVVAKDTSDGPEVVVPVCLPDKGTFDWCDKFLKDNPKFSELSNRALQDWGIKSGLRLPRPNIKKCSNDQPDMGFNIPALDDGSIKDVLLALAPMQGRSYVLMDVKGNLTKDDRMATLAKFEHTPVKKVAQVMMGMPEEGFRNWVHAQMLADRQALLDRDFENGKEARAQKKIEDEKRRSIQRAMKKADKMRRQAEQEEKAKGEEGEAKDEEMKEEESEDEKMEEGEDKAPVASLTLAEKQINFRKVAHGDLSQIALDKFFDKFSLPDETEGFDEIRYVWGSAEDCVSQLRRWMVERKLTTRIEDLQPSEWFKEKWADWQKDLHNWHQKHMEAKDPSKTKPDSILAQAKDPSLSKAGPSKPPASLKEALNVVSTDGKENAGADSANTADALEDKDPMVALEEELDREDIDIFAVEDVSDHDGQPLYSNFAFEDWALLSLRFELHLLTHAFRHDADDPERTGIHPEHLAFYYNRYYKKGLNPKNYGVDTVEELVELVKETVTADARSKVVESLVGDDLEGNDIFVKLTEECRRDRQRRVDAGEEAAALKFSKPAGGPGASNMLSAAPAAQVATSKAQGQPNLGIKPKATSGAANALSKAGFASGQMGVQGMGGGGMGGMGGPGWAGGFGGGMRPNWGAGVRPNMGGMNRANMMGGGGCGWGNPGFQKPLWGANWRG